MVANLSIHAIPVYWVMALWPHVVAAMTIKAVNVKPDNINPNGANNKARIQEKCSSEVYAKWERAEAAHHNLLENAPLFIGAVIAGNIAELEPSTMNTAVAAYLGLRFIYVILYLNTTTRKNSFFRSLNWAVSTGVLFTVLVKAGNKIAWN